MSDTPRTNAVLDWFYDDMGGKYAVIDKFTELCYELERENAALRERLRDSEHSQSVWMQHAKQSDQKLAAAQQAHLCDLDRRANIAASARKAKDENAELREDKERLDFGCIIVREMDEMGNFVPVLHKGINLRAAIDAARKEERL